MWIWPDRFAKTFNLQLFPQRRETETTFEFRRGMIWRGVWWNKFYDVAWQRDPDQLTGRKSREECGLRNSKGNSRTKDVKLAKLWGSHSGAGFADNVELMSSGNTKKRWRKGLATIGIARDCKAINQMVQPLLSVCSVLVWFQKSNQTWKPVYFTNRDLSNRCVQIPR